MPNFIPVVVEAQDAPHVPTSETRLLVEGMVACGLDAREIAYVFGTSVGQINMHYSQQIEHGLHITNAKVGAALLKSALKGDSNAQQFWLRSRAKWVTPTRVENTGADGGPIELEIGEKKKLMDDIVSLVAKSKYEERQGEVAAVANPGSKRSN